MEVSDTTEQEQPPLDLANNLAAPTQPRFLIKFTIDGERIVEVTPEGQEIEHPFIEEQLPDPLPKGFTVAHRSEMDLFHSFIRTVKKNRPKRSIPVTRTELKKIGADPKIIDALINIGFLKAEIVPLIREDGKNPGSRLCFYYTPLGRAYVKAKIDPSYMRFGEESL